MKHASIFLPLLALLALPSAARAADEFEPELRLHLSGAGMVNLDESIRWVAESRRTGRVEVGAGATVIPGLTILGEFSHGRTSEWVLGAVDTALKVQTFGVRGRYAFDLIPIVRPYVTASVGLAVATNEVGTSTADLEDRAFAFAWDAAAGVEAQTPGRFSAGMFTDYGYACRTPFRFEGEPRSSDAPDSTVDLGEIRMRGFQWRLGAFFSARF